MQCNLSADLSAFALFTTKKAHPYAEIKQDNQASVTYISPRQTLTLQRLCTYAGAPMHMSPTITATPPSPG